MLVENIMTTDVHTISPSTTVQQALQKMHHHHIHHLPIVDEYLHVVGMITHRKLMEVLPSTLIDNLEPSLFHTCVETIMQKDPIIGHPLDSVEEIAYIFYETPIGCLPIVSSGKLVGIVTTTDLLSTYIELTGAHKPGSKLKIRIADTPGTLHEVTEVFRDYHMNVQNMLVYQDAHNPNFQIIDVRLQTLNPSAVIQQLQKQGFEVIGPCLSGECL